MISNQISGNEAVSGEECFFKKIVKCYFTQKFHVRYNNRRETAEWTGKQGASRENCTVSSCRRWQIRSASSFLPNVSSQCYERHFVILSPLSFKLSIQETLSSWYNAKLTHKSHSSSTHFLWIISCNSHLLNSFILLPSISTYHLQISNYKGTYTGIPVNYPQVPIKKDTFFIYL